MATHKKKTTRKTPTIKQKAQRAKMKKAIAEAKKHQKAHPKMQWKDCLKYGWSKVN